MPEIYLRLTEEDAFIVLGVWLMYTGYPFHRTSKLTFGGHKATAGEAVWERLLALRDSARTRAESEGLVKMVKAPFVLLPLTDEEISFYVEMTQACLDECGENEVDVRLHLSDSGREAVERVLDKLQRVE